MGVLKTTKVPKMILVDLSQALSSGSVFDVYVHMLDIFNHAREIPFEQTSPANTPLHLPQRFAFLVSQPPKVNNPMDQ